MATVMRVVPGVLACVSGENGNAYAFTFDKINGYRGEYIRELKQFGRRGMRRGVKVAVEIDETNRVFRVYPSDDVHKED